MSAQKIIDMTISSIEARQMSEAAHYDSVACGPNLRRQHLGDDCVGADHVAGGSRVMASRMAVNRDGSNTLPTTTSLRCGYGE